MKPVEEDPLHVKPWQPNPGIGSAARRKELLIGHKRLPVWRRRTKVSVKKPPRFLRSTVQAYTLRDPACGQLQSPLHKFLVSLDASKHSSIRTATAARLSSPKALAPWVHCEEGPFLQLCETVNHPRVHNVVGLRQTSRVVESAKQVPGIPAALVFTQRGRQSAHVERSPPVGIGIITVEQEGDDVGQVGVLANHAQTARLPVPPRRRTAQDRVLLKPPCPPLSFPKLLNGLRQLSTAACARDKWHQEAQQNVVERLPRCGGTLHEASTGFQTSIKKAHDQATHRWARIGATSQRTPALCEACQPRARPP